MIRRVAASLAMLTMAGCITGPLPPERSPYPPPPAGEQSAIGTPGNPPFYEVMGQRYHVMPSATGYRERGVASWYGEKFHGRNTSNGERYDMYALTAAHKTLPLPTWVRVTNLRNGASIVVRVNDRGPFVKNRLIDLSFSAASALDMVGAGTTLVEVQALPGQPATAGTTAATGASGAATPPVQTGTVASETRPYVASTVVEPAVLTPDAVSAEVSSPPDRIAWTPVFVQVGAFGDLVNARRMEATLYNAAIEKVRVADGERNGLPLYRVQIGPLDGVSEYDSLVARLEAIGIVETHLITE